MERDIEMSSPVGVDRREVLKRAVAIGGAGTAAAALASFGTAEGAAAAGRSRVKLDVACLGDTLRIQPQEGNTEGDFRGSLFIVEGNVYPAGTISQETFDPASAKAIGTWFCRGWLLGYPERPEPHVITTQEYVLGTIRPDRLFPPDTLVSSGTEGVNAEFIPGAEAQVPIRSVVGGTGKYAGATGVVRQVFLGSNTTTLSGIGPAPNFRFKFRLWIPPL